MKARILALLVFVLSLSVLVYASGKINETEKFAEVIETTLSGDISNAEGVKLSFGAHAGERLAWKCTYDFGAKQGKTEFQTYEKEPYLLSTWPKNEPAASIRNDVWFPGALDVLNPRTPEDARKQKDILAKCDVQWAETAGATAKAFTEGVKPGEYKHKSVYIKDIFKYYPIDYSFSSGGIGHYLHFEEIAAEYTYEELKMLRDVNEFFRIPVAEKERKFCKFTVNSGGQITDFDVSDSNESGTRYSEEIFDLNMRYCNTESAFYMLFDAHLVSYYGEDLKGKTVDTSKIKGGFGIYKLPCDLEKSKFDTGKLQTVYPLNPSNYYETIETSPDEKSLLVIARDAQKVWAEVIRISDMKRVQKIDLIDLTEGRDEVDMGIGFRKISDNAYLIFNNEGQLAVMRFANGKYHKDMAASGLQTELTSYDALDREDTLIEYDGKRLVIAGYVSLPGVPYDSVWDLPDEGMSCVAGLAVLEAGELAYCGRLTTNLMDYSDKESVEAFITQKEDARTGRLRGFWKENLSSVTKRCGDMLEIII